MGSTLIDASVYLYLKLNRWKASCHCAVSSGSQSNDTTLYYNVIDCISQKTFFNYDVYLLAAVGDYYFTKMGFFLTVLGTLLAALKTVVTNRVLVGRLKLHPFDLLLRMSPLAFVQTVIYAYVTGELNRVRTFSKNSMTTSLVIALVANGIIAFFLNYVSFTANKKTSPLTMTVAGNVKQVLSIILAVVIFNLTITPTNGLGIFLTLLGGAWYA
ncbi:3068_t:CDS:2 [Paraglomus occultum]|uniref:3068_t:CDS:1 n=1 Tax=Paraglomus occultum TaxID=144539 RepID=A0A9N9FQE5_9GLOM|nr:3068_t:CDS:2 [Paraglomus occultum]